MAFYGRANIAENTDFRFDRIYSNRAEMDANTSSDGIFLNRYILIEYDKEFKVSGGDKELYGEENYNKIVTILAEEGLTPHQKNSKIDSTIYQAVREYDSTVWMKTSIHTDDGNEKIKYVQIAELNSVVPTLNIKVVAPSLTAEQVSEQKNIGIEELPGFDKTNSTNITYDLYMQPIWDFTEDSEVLNIDTDVIEGHTSQDGEGIFVTLTTDDNIESNDLDINGKINKRFSFEFPIIGNMFTKLYTILYGGTGEYLTNPMNGTIMSINRDFQAMKANKIPGCLGAGRYVGFDFGFNTTDGVSFKTNDIAYSEETKEYKMQIDVEINSDGVFLGEDFAEKVSETLKELLNNPNDLTKQKLTDAIIALDKGYDQFTKITNEIVETYTEAIDKTVNNYISEFNELETAYNQLNWANKDESFQMATSSNYLIDNNYQADLSKEEPIQPNDTLNTALAKLEGQIANNTIDQMFVINEENAGNLPAVIENKLVFIENNELQENEICASLHLQTQNNESKEIIHTVTEFMSCIILNTNAPPASGINEYYRGSWLYADKDWNYYIAIPKLEDFLFDYQSKIEFLISYQVSGETQEQKWIFENIQFIQTDFNFTDAKTSTQYVFFTPREEYKTEFTNQLFSQVQTYYTSTWSSYENKVSEILFSSNPPRFCPIWTEPISAIPTIAHSYTDPETQETTWYGYDITFMTTYRGYEYKIIPTIEFKNCKIMGVNQSQENYITFDGQIKFSNCDIQSLSFHHTLSGEDREIITNPRKMHSYSWQQLLDLLDIRYLQFNNCKLYNITNLINTTSSGMQIALQDCTVNNSIFSNSVSEFGANNTQFNKTKFVFDYIFEESAYFAEENTFIYVNGERVGIRYKEGYEYDTNIRTQTYYFDTCEFNLSYINILCGREYRDWRSVYNNCYIIYPDNLVIYNIPRTLIGCRGRLAGMLQENLDNTKPNEINTLNFFEVLPR